MKKFDYEGLRKRKLMNFILFLFYFSRLLSSALPLKSMYLLLLCKSMSGVLNKQFITTEIRRKVISWRTYDQYIGEFNDLVSILSANFSDKKIFPDPWIPNRDIYIYIYFSMLETLWEKRKGKLGRYCVIAISISRKNGQEGRKGGRKEGLHAIRETPSILDRRKMARCDEKAREESRQLSRVIDRREIRPEISRSLSRFFPPPPAFLPDFLPLVIATRTSKGEKERISR